MGRHRKDLKPEERSIYREIRERRCLSAADMAAALEIARPHYYRLELEGRNARAYRDLGRIYRLSGMRPAAFMKLFLEIYAPIELQEE